MALLGPPSGRPSPDEGRVTAFLRVLWAIARHDVALWLRAPGLFAASLFPALGMGVLVGVLTLSIGRQPVALVQEGDGPIANHMAHLLEVDDEAYVIQRTDRTEARRAFDELRVAAVLIIPSDFDDRIATADSHVELWLDNVVDVDLADDVRRTVTRSLAELDAPQLGIIGELHGPTAGLLLPNPFRVAIAERDRRETSVQFFEYELVSILVLIVISVGLLGSALLVSREHQRRTLKTILLSPVPRSAIVIGKLLGGMLVTTLALAPVFAASMAAGWLNPPAGHWPALIALLGTLMLASVCLGLALGIAIKKTRLVAMLGLNVAAYLFFLGGGFSTVAFLPDWLRAVSRFVPTSYAISGLRQVLFYPDLDGVGRDLSVLILTALLTGGIGVGALRRLRHA
jgi:ABC-type multidrug transport system permease subunit